VDIKNRECSEEKKHLVVALGTGRYHAQNRGHKSSSSSITYARLRAKYQN